MNRDVVRAILRVCAKAVFLTAAIGAIIAVIGRLNQWSSPVTYSNAFFLAGALAIIAGASSRFAAGQEWSAFQMLDASTFRGMSSGERADFIVKASSSVSTVIVGVLTGLLLMVISAIAAGMS